MTRLPRVIYRLRWRWDEHSPWRGPKWFTQPQAAYRNAHRIRGYGLQVELSRAITPTWEPIYPPPATHEEPST